MNYEKYVKARDASWEVLLDCKIDTMSISINAILECLEVKKLRYCDNKDFLQKNGYSELIEKSDGFAVKYNNQFYIFYSEHCIEQRKRYILAHELGHIVLNHFGQKNRDKVDDEKQANVFASRLLAPAFILHELKLFSTEGIVSICNVSNEFAQYRLERIIELENRNKDYIESKGYGCFYLSKEEKKLKEQFSTYLQEKKIK